VKLLSHLDRLEAEAIFILRETAAQFERPVLMFSGGKDSITLAHLAAKAFRPALSPFPYLHIDTGHNFPETLAFRDRFAAQMGAKLIVRLVEDSIRQGRAAEEKGKFPSRNRQQAVTLVDAIAELKLDACIGGGRRDEEKARAKERIFSVRDEFGGWEPRLQRPEAVESAQRPYARRRERAGLSAQQLDRAGCVAVYPRRARGSARPVLRAPAGVHRARRIAVPHIALRAHRSRR